MTIPPTPRLAALAASIAGTLAWIAYANQDLVLSHYDAKAHLVVARRVIDSLTPGWQQIGAVWLPLPHLIQLLPTQVDLLYRTGAFGSLVSIASFTVAVWAATRLALAITGSHLGAATAAALLILNPNLLYLQSTPMTEPLLLGVTFLVVLWMYEWVAADAGSARANDGHAGGVRHQPDPPTRLGVSLFAAAWTRYEGWLVVAAALATAAYVLWRHRVPANVLGRQLARLAAWPAVAVGVFLLISRITVGAWFVTGGFYVPDPAYEGRAWRSLIAVWWGTHQLSGYVIATTALAAGAALCGRALLGRAAAAPVVSVALFAAAALPFYAFHAGHPFRIRYMVPCVAASAVLSGIAVGWLRHRAARAAAPLLALLLVGSSLVESPPFDGRAPMLEEAQWDVPRSRERQVVTACLAPHYRGEKVMASMGSLAHYMQELSHQGFDIADFLHEGNGVLWEFAIETGPAPHAGWMLVEEQAEGGDVLAQRLRQDATFARGMTRVCEGGGVALYRREPTSRSSDPEASSQVERPAPKADPRVSPRKPAAGVIARSARQP